MFSQSVCYDNRYCIVLSHGQSGLTRRYLGNRSIGHVILYIDGVTCRGYEVTNQFYNDIRNGLYVPAG